MAAKAAATLAELNTGDLKLQGFKAYETDTSVNPVPTYRCRDFYKVALVRGHCTVHYADRSIDLAKLRHCAPIRLGRGRHWLRPGVRVRLLLQ